MQYFRSLGKRYYAYSLARYAFLDALKVLQIASGETVIVPAFICKDMLDPLYIAGVLVEFLDLDENLTPVLTPDLWPNAKAVLAVNYFGIECDMEIYERYRDRTGAFIIEDNAHGFLSRSKNGQLLGTRGDVGLFSLRKTFLISDGAVLLLNNCALEGLPHNISRSFFGYQPLKFFKFFLKCIPLANIKISNFLVSIKRLCSSSSGLILEASPIVPSIPYKPDPWMFLELFTDSIDLNKEKCRRSKAYITVGKYAKSIGATPVYSDISENTVPYGYAFRANATAIKAIAEFSKSRGWDVINWPDLPSEFNNVNHYKNIYIVNFI